MAARGAITRGGVRAEAGQAAGARRHRFHYPKAEITLAQRRDIQKILIIGSGPIVIGQACEFDYSGTQGC